jgi:hypothetical protein
MQQELKKSAKRIIKFETTWWKIGNAIDRELVRIYAKIRLNPRRILNVDPLF